MNNAAMTTAASKLTAAQFDLLCDAVGWARSSLGGCTRSETAKEAVHLRAAVAELAGAVLARKNDRLEERRVMMIQSATRQLIQSFGTPTNDTIGEGTVIEFKGNMGARGFQACITMIVGTSHFHARLDNGELTKAPLPLALLQTSQWRIVR